MVIQLCKQLPPADEYILYTDNFFTSTKLYKVLSTLEIGACGTAKAGSGYSASLLALRDAINKKNNWGLEVHTVIENEMLRMDLDRPQYGAVDSHCVWPIRCWNPLFLSPRRPHDIPENSIKLIPLTCPLSPHIVPLLALTLEWGCWFHILSDDTINIWRVQMAMLSSGRPTRWKESPFIIDGRCSPSCITPHASMPISYIGLMIRSHLQASITGGPHQERSDGVDWRICRQWTQKKRPGGWYARRFVARASLSAAS